METMNLERRTPNVQPARHSSSFILHPSSFILHPSSFILHPSLLHLGDRPGVDAVVAKELWCYLLPAAEGVDLPQVLHGGVAVGGRLQHVGIDRAQAEIGK